MRETKIGKAIRAESAEAEASSAFVKRPASDWMRLAGEKPPQRKLLGDLISENELTVVFSMTNIGKTALMVQVANCIASGTALEPFENECGPQRVLYFDFELNDRQFARRYVGEDGDFVFSDNFIRAQVNAGGRCDGMDYGEFMLVCIEREIASCRAKVAVVDNISFLSNELDKGRSAGNLIKRLKEIKERLGITMIVLAHTPKRDGKEPLELRDLYGSSIISILVDSCFAMGLSAKDPRARYIKQLKTRNDEFRYGGDNVCLFELSKAGNMLRFSFIGYVREKDHLGGYSAEARQKLMERIITLAEDPTLSYRDIGAQVGISGMSVMRKIKDYYASCGEKVPERPQAGRKKKRTGK